MVSAISSDVFDVNTGSTSFTSLIFTVNIAVDVNVNVEVSVTLNKDETPLCITLSYLTDYFDVILNQYI